MDWVVTKWLQEKFEWIEEPVDKTVKQGLCDEVSFIAKLSHKGKKAKWYLRNQVGTNSTRSLFDNGHPIPRSSTDGIFKPIIFRCRSWASSNSYF